MLAVLIALYSVAGGQQTETLKAHPGLRELRFPNVALDADVTWEAKKPLDLDWRSFELASGETSFLWCARAGETYVVAIDVIDWEARKRTRKTWIVEVEGGPDPGPGPNPPGPDPPTPGPDPPVPDDDVPSKFGIGPIIYPAIQQISDKSNFGDVITVMVKAENALNSRQVTSYQALQAIQKTLDGFAEWSSAAAVINQAINKAGEQHGRGTVHTKNYIREARLTIEVLQ